MTIRPDTATPPHGDPLRGEIPTHPCSVFPARWLETINWPTARELEAQGALVLGAFVPPRAKEDK